MAQVHVLPPAIANQIAAGEVVERPASAAKELIENALDARATRCDVTCQGGGVTLLSVRDDGFGMTEEDAVRAVERHATSKLTELADLNHLDTFGFRGEALPTIASVSRFSLRTRAKDSEFGCAVEIDCGKAPVVRREGLPVGTTVTLRDLFVNVPARRKFLRSTGTESAHVTAALEGAALSRHDVTFTLERDGRKVRELLRVASRRERVLQLLPEESLAEIRGERGPLRFEAHLSRPERARPGASGLWLLVNGRVVRDRLLAATVAQAYGAALSPGSYPRGVVYVDLPSELVDVNVHPQKAEVRFVDGRALADAVYAIVSRAVTTEFAIASGNRGARYAQPSRSQDASPMGLLPVERGIVPKRHHDPQTDHAAAAPARHAAHATTDHAAAPPTVARVEREPDAATLRPPPAPAPPAPPPPALSQADVEPDDVDEPAPATMVTPPSDPTFGSAARATDFESGITRTHTRSLGPLRFLAQIRQSYLVCEGPDGLYVVHQHAASQCVTYAKLLAEYLARKVMTETLLFPAMLELTPSELNYVESQVELFREFGLDVRARGTDRVSIHSTPRLLPRAKPERLVRVVLAEFGTNATARDQATVERAISSMACHGCLGSDEPLAPEQAQDLLDAFTAVETTTRCAHGRPLSAVVRYADLDRQAGRR